MDGHGAQREPDAESYFTGRDAWFTAGGDDDAPTSPPPASPSIATVTEPAREIPVHEETDVLVVGGGPAGTAAAIAARRLGQRVTVVERYGDLGGLSAGGLVIWIDRMTDWQGTQVIAGIGSELLDRLPQGAVAGPGPELWGSTDPDEVAYWRERLSAFRDTVCKSPMIDPEWLKIASHEMLVGAGVRVLLHSWVVAAITDGDRGQGRDLREQAGSPGDPGQGRRGRHRRPRRLRAGRRRVRHRLRDRRQGRQRPALHQHRVHVVRRRLHPLAGVQAGRSAGLPRLHGAGRRGRWATSRRRTSAGATTSSCSWAPA